MKKKIIDIATDLSKGKLTTKEAKDELLYLFGVVGQSEQFSLADMKNAFEAGESQEYKCIADGKERKCHCRNDNDCSWREYVDFESWIKSQR